MSFLHHIPATVTEQDIEWLILDFSVDINLDTYVADNFLKSMSLLGIEPIIIGCGRFSSSCHPDWNQISYQVPWLCILLE
ncbi:hypothetical protein [Sediminibacillus dalangtanensis]|uniref:hypothetical protein n=1 Tax=Sediminibacillus dalangtanensis TaxID=2729421 RepID=UPI001AE04B84|nr:hypothetical protein [Sediminibacillus dalangtanensis]